MIFSKPCTTFQTSFRVLLSNTWFRINKTLGSLLFWATQYNEPGVLTNCSCTAVESSCRLVCYLCRYVVWLSIEWCVLLHTTIWYHHASFWNKNFSCKQHFYCVNACVQRTVLLSPFCLSVRLSNAFCDKTTAPIERSSIMTDRKSTTRFPMSLRWTAYVAPKPPKGALKNAKWPFWV